MSSPFNDGGPAFPSEKLHQYRDGTRLVPVFGMSLRDWFAGQAMAAIIMGNGADATALTLGAAKDAYAVADAMLEARK